MKPLDLQLVNNYVATNFVHFQRGRLSELESLKLTRLLKRKNPYLLRVKNMNTPRQIVNDLLNDRLSVLEERFFGMFLESIAIFVAVQMREAYHSSAMGVDFELINKNIHYLVSVKSETNWGNYSQQRMQRTHFREAVERLKERDYPLRIRPVVGICSGAAKLSKINGYVQVVGQRFWHFISGDTSLYQTIIELFTTQAQDYNDQFNIEHAKIAERFTDEMVSSYCHKDGMIDWAKLIELNSGNMLPDETLTTEVTE